MSLPIGHRSLDNLETQLTCLFLFFSHMMHNLGSEWVPRPYTTNLIRRGLLYRLPMTTTPSEGGLDRDSRLLHFPDQGYVIQVQKSGDPELLGLVTPPSYC